MFCPRCNHNLKKEHVCPKCKHEIILRKAKFFAIQIQPEQLDRQVLAIHHVEEDTKKSSTPVPNIFRQRAAVLIAACVFIVSIVVIYSLTGVLNDFYKRPDPTVPLQEKKQTALIQNSNPPPLLTTDSYLVTLYSNPPPLLTASITNASSSKQ